MDNIELITIGISAVLSVVLEHAPKINMWWSKQVTRKQKQLYIVILAVCVSVVVNVLACYTNISQMDCINWHVVFYSLVSFVGTHSLVKD